MSTHAFSLHQLGWRPFYSQQLTLDHLEAGYPARVAVVQRSSLTVLTESGELSVTVPPYLRPDEARPAITVGDWVLVQHDAPQAIHLIERQSLIARVAAGSDSRPQSIAANVDTLFVVMSCNADFNLSRLERYLAVAFEARVTPVIALTKADLCADVAPLVSQAEAIARNVAVVALDATNATRSIESLQPWLAPGQTIAFVGSSGVGKSTLTNTLLGAETQETSGIRESDSKGRHTTTARFLTCTPGGVWLIDTPGMRELKIGAATTGISRTFSDIEELAAQCRFRDCSHQHDNNGCALQAAVAEGKLEARRLTSFLKLEREAARATQTRWQEHQNNRAFGRMARASQKRKRRETGRD
jgi:ribosome biogenesis GTPase / thiamine phosphate phosphatase